MILASKRARLAWLAPRIRNKTKEDSVDSSSARMSVLPAPKMNPNVLGGLAQREAHLIAATALALTMLQTELVSPTQTVDRVIVNVAARLQVSLNEDDATRGFEFTVITNTGPNKADLLIQASPDFSLLIQAKPTRLHVSVGTPDNVSAAMLLIGLRNFPTIAASAGEAVMMAESGELDMTFTIPLLSTAELLRHFVRHITA